MQKRNVAGILAFIIAVAALSVGLVPIFFADYFAPPSKPAAEVLADLKSELKARIDAKKRGETYVAPPEAPDPRAEWHRKVTSAGVLLGIFGLVAALTSFIRREDQRVWASAAGLAAVALLVPLIYMALALVAGAFVIAAVLTCVGATGCSC